MQLFTYTLSSKTFEFKKDLDEDDNSSEEFEYAVDSAITYVIVVKALKDDVDFRIEVTETPSVFRGVFVLMFLLLICCGCCCMAFCVASCVRSKVVSKRLKA